MVGHCYSTIYIALFFSLHLLISTTKSEEFECQDELIVSSRDHAVNDEADCTLFLAPSTIPNAGLGIFTGVHRSVNETIDVGDPCIPIFEPYYYPGNRSDIFRNPFFNYAWQGKEMGIHWHTAIGTTQALCFGLDAAVNCNLALINVAKGSSEYDSSNYHRSTDPGSGASTPYHNSDSRVLADIPAGGELFKFYGDRWFVVREEKFGKKLPLYDDYEFADILLSKFYGITRQLKSLEAMEDAWNITKNTIGKLWESRTMNAVPDSLEDVADAAIHGLSSLYQKNATRSIASLKDNGRCLDHIRHGKSTVPQAGRGAFARNFLPKGTIITGSPLAHAPKREFFHIHRMDKDEKTGSYRRYVDEILTYQLVLNYCFGHWESTMLLCPYGAGVNYINHNQTRANVRVRWAPNGISSHNDTWLKTARVEDFEVIDKTVLAFDYVATRDIAKGEELFLNYGSAFEEEWQKHVVDWPKATRKAKSYMSAHDFNQQFNTSLLRTQEEQKEHPYPDNLQIRCHSQLKTIKVNSTLHWKHNDGGLPCRILQRHEEEMEDLHYYKVEIAAPSEDTWGKRMKTNLLVRNRVPRKAFKFFDVPFSADIMLTYAFRKEIGIPDNIFPEQWRNLRPGEGRPSINFWEFEEGRNGLSELG